MAINSWLLERWQLIKQTSDSHPYAQWITVIDPRCAASCLDLNGKAWRVDGKSLSDLIYNHIAQQHGDCRCRLRPVTLAAIAKEHVQTMD